MGPHPLRALVAFLCAFVVAACRTTETLSPPAALRALEPLPITLSDGLRHWRTERAASQTRYRLGETLLTLFPAHDGRAFLSPLSSSLESGFDAERGAFVARYELRLALQLDGARHELVAQGSGRSPEDVGSAERAALGECLAALYASARELVARRDA